MSILSNFTAYVKQAWANRPALTSPLSAARFNHMEAGIKANSDAIEQIANAVLSNIVNDPNKIASMAVAYSLQEQITKLNGDKLKTSVVTLSNLSTVALSADYHYANVTEFANKKGIKPENIVALQVTGTSGFSSSPVVLEYSLSDDRLMIKSLTAATSGTVGLKIWYT